MMSGIPESEFLEYRMQRLLFYLGYFTRRRITLKSYFYPEKADITDLDVIGVAFSNNFYPNVIIGECKSGAKESTIDRILWISGLRQYFSSNQAFIARKKISQKVKDFAKEMNVLAFDYSRISELEKDLGILEDSWIGSHDYEYYYPRLKEYYKNLSKENSELSKIYWFIRSEFWYADNPIRLKKIITASENLSRYNISTVNMELRETLRWLIYESVILFSVSLLYFCSDLFSLDSDQRQFYIKYKIEYGLIPPQEMKKILNSIYKYADAIVRMRTGEGLSRAEKPLKIPLPEYTSDLIELVERLLAKPKQASEIPRFLDVAFYEYLLKDKEVDEQAIKQVFPNDFNLILKLSKNVLNFMISNCNLSEELFSELLSL